MKYFEAVRIYATIEAAIFTSLLVVWIGGLSDQAQFVLGLTHGIGWILLCGLVFEGCRRRLFTWPVLAHRGVPRSLQLDASVQNGLLSRVGRECDRTPVSRSGCMRMAKRPQQLCAGGVVQVIVVERG